MEIAGTSLIAWLVVLGSGLMIGAERERRHARTRQRSSAGIRTFTIASLLGAIAMTVGKESLLGLVTAGVFALTGVAYWRSAAEDRGLTTEIALVATTLLGGLAMRHHELAAALAVVVTILLAGRAQLHTFVGTVLTEDEAYHGLMFAAATLVVLPLIPNRAMGPFGAINPHAIWLIAILVMGISAAGYIAVRLLGAHLGLPVAGLVSGFVSSTATIGAMATRAVADTTFLSGAIAGSILSTVATVVQLALVLAATSTRTFETMLGPLALAGLAAVAYGAWFTIGAMQAPEGETALQGEPFSIRTALIFAGTLAAILLLSAALGSWFGQRGAIAAAAIAGFVDVHSAAISVAALVVAGKMTASEAVVPILVAFTTNTISKVVVARTSGPGPFAVRVVPGLLLVAAGAWAGLLVPNPLK